MIFNRWDIEKTSIAFLLSVFCGIILLAAWISTSLFFLLFIAFIPLFFIVDQQICFCKNPITLWIFAYLALFTWNLDNAWILQINKPGGWIVLIINPFLLSLPFILLIIARKKSFLIRYSLFISSWLFFEWLLQKWELAFPLLILGNGLGANPTLIQWFEYTGVAGGSLWILLINVGFYILLDYSLKRECSQVKRWLVGTSLVLLIVCPVCISLFIYRNYKEEGTKIEVLGLDTHLNCFHEKYASGNERLATDYVQSTRESLSNSTILVCWPETALPEPVYLYDLQRNTIIRRIKDSFREYPLLKIITGLVIREEVNSPLNGHDVRLDKVTGKIFREYNAAIQLIPSSGEIEIKTKEHCVPGTEKMPYPKMLSFLTRYIKTLGGFSFSTSNRYGDTYFASLGKLCVKPVICYEIAFQDVVNMNPGCETVFCLLMNEGWYHNLNVSKHFSVLSSIRAIESRRSIIRSSNQGISGTVDQRGICNLSTSGFGTHAFKSNIYANATLSFFSKYSSAIAKLINLAFLVSLISLVCSNTNEDILQNNEH